MSTVAEFIDKELIRLESEDTQLDAQISELQSKKVANRVRIEYAGELKQKLRRVNSLANLRPGPKKPPSNGSEPPQATETAPQAPKAPTDPN
jgi:U3 small nucleolar ribonucleoprotein component